VGCARAKKLASVKEKTMRRVSLPAMSGSLFVAISFLALFCGTSRAVILIDANTRNGSFEAGHWSPWNDSGDILVNDASFASQGSWYAKLETTTGRESIFQTLAIDKNNGTVFLMRADVRNGVKPFDTIQLSIYGQTYSGQFVNATLNLFEIPASAASGWVTLSATAEFAPAAWQALNPAKIWVSVNVSEHQAGDALHQGFLDNISLRQVPEPASLAFLTLGIIAIAAKRR
jgi:hypothetical protein